jgi:transcriptional antiterminator RfaH
VSARAVEEGSGLETGRVFAVRSVHFVVPDQTSARDSVFAVNLAGGAPADACKWLAYYTAPRHEKVVAKHLVYRSVDCYLPVLRRPRRWKNGVRVQVEEPFFPGYIFARVDPQSYYEVLSVPGMLSVVGPGRRPSVLDDKEIESLRNGLTERNSRPHPFLVMGRKARIVSGAFAGKTGVLLKEATDLRVVLTLDAIMKSFSVEVDGDELEMVS